MEKSGFVAGTYLPEPTEEIIQQALKPIEERERIITVNRELLEKGAVVVVWNIKTYTAAWKWIDSHREIIKVPQEKLDVWRTWRKLPRGRERWQGGFRAFVLSHIGDVKPDAYGLPGGKIERYEYDASDARRKIFETAIDYEDSGEHYSDYAFHRELVEETGVIAIRNKKPLFERIIQFYEDDREHPEDMAMEHRDYFFWVSEAIGELNKVGVEEETLAPEIVPIMSLRPSNFYKKHAHGLMATLDRLVNKYGKTEYRDALQYLRQTFQPCEKLRREPRVNIPEMKGLSDEDIFAYTMRQDKVTPLQR